MKCPLCNSQSKLTFTVKGFEILDCLACNHRFTNIRTDATHVEKVYDHSYFHEGGAGYSDYLLESDLLYERGKKYAKKIQKVIAQKGRVLDVGSAAGFILKGYVDEGWHGIGIEPNLEMAKYGCQELGLEIKQGAFENYKTPLKFDFISMIQVVSHFYEQKKAFENASKLLKKGGYLLIESWDRNSISAKIFGKKWHEYSPPSVLHWYSLKSLTNYLTKFGFERIEHGRPAKKISGRHIKSLLKYHLGESAILNIIPEKMKFRYPSEDLFWVIFRKI